ncbi:MAG: LptF/LptG family permease [Saprospiraceae bacterium]|nr:LptF/LptG family permease [Saprospiraceae bacterium]
MLNLLERYILKKHISTFLYFVFAFVMIICIIDFTEKNDDFMHHELSYWVVMRDYYFNLIPYLANFLSPIMIFISTIFVTSKLASHTEIIAILSSGVSFARVLWIYVKGSLFLSVIIFILIGWVLPNANKTRVNFEVEYLKNKFTYNKINTHVRVSENTYVYMETYNNEREYGTGFSIERFDGKDLVYKLQGPRVKWDSISGKWHVNRYIVRTYNEGVEKLSFGVHLDTALNLYPKDFKSTFKKQESMTISELSAFIKKQKDRGFQDIEIYEIEYFERFTYPLAIMVLTIMGVIVSARKSREGIAAQIIIGFVLAFTYILIVMLGRNFAQDGSAHPLVTALMPNIIFGVISYVLYKKIPR